MTLCFVLLLLFIFAFLFVLHCFLLIQSLNNCLTIFLLTQKSIEHALMSLYKKVIRNNIKHIIN